MCVSWRAALALLCACAVVVADRELDKRAELSQAPFVMGSRYGRSPPSEPRLITPRNDRFFMGSRYGKRSMLSPPGDLLVPPGGPPVHHSLVCEFTGVAPLYRCERRTLRPYGPRKSDDDPSNDGEEE